MVFEEHRSSDDFTICSTSPLIHANGMDSIRYVIQYLNGVRYAER